MTAERVWGSYLFKGTKVNDAVAKYAVQTEKNELAQQLFERASPSDRWLLYVDAYEAVTVDSRLLADWRLRLETDTEQHPELEAEARAARLLALTEIKLHDYAATTDSKLKGEHQQQALQYRQKLHEPLQSMLKRDDKGCSTVLELKANDFKRRLNIAFARAGVWKGIEELDPNYRWRHDPARHKNGELIAKAFAGKLNHLQKSMLKLGGNTGKVLRWADARRKGDDAPPPILLMGISFFFQDQSMLEELAPELLRELDFNPTNRLSDLKMILATRDFEAAEAKYTRIAGFGSGRDDVSTVLAALLMSRYTHDVQSTTVAHEIYNGALLRELEPIEAYVNACKQRGEASRDEVASRNQLFEIYGRTFKLQDPAGRMLAQARLLPLYHAVAPERYEVNQILNQIRTSWTILEQREGSDVEIAMLSKALQATGLHFVRQWKQLNQGGYVGYVPLSSLATKPPRAERSHHEPERKILLMEQTARELNALLNEECYVIVRHSGKRISMAGTCQSYPSHALFYASFDTAKELLHRKRQLHTEPELTSRLQSLIEQDL